MRFLKALAGLLTLALTTPSLAQTHYPLVKVNGQTETLPTGAGLQLNPSAAGAPSLNLACAAGITPTMPQDGDAWCTSAGLYIRVGGTTIGPLGTGGGSGGTVTTTGSTPSGSLAKFSGVASITSGDLSGDCATSAGLTITCTETNGVAFGFYATGTSAANLTGTAPNAVIPSPTTSALGGVESKTCTTSAWFDALSTGGILSCTQPAFTDISGSASASQIATNLSGALDGACGSAQGDILYRGASTWVCLAPGASGQVLASGGVSANPGWVNMSGSGGAIDQYGPPSSSSFTVTGVGTGSPAASASDVAGLGMVFSGGATTGSATDEIQTALQNIPASTPWTISVRLRYNIIPQALRSAGLALSDGTKIKTFGFIYNGNGQGMFVANYTSSTAFSGYVANGGGEGGWWLFQYIQIKDDGTNWTYSVSNDGQTWTRIAKEARNSFLTATKIGFFIDTQDRGSDYAVGDVPSITCPWWKQS